MVQTRKAIIHKLIKRESLMKIKVMNVSSDTVTTSSFFGAAS
nr:MAG TPA: hypothetical protein [Bacteriophage sp.]